jgi:hypothetical protein
MKLSNFAKKVILKLLLSVYIIGCTHSLWPIIKDTLAHTFYEKQHIASVHYENGHYHLHIELSQSTKEKPSEHKSIAHFENLAIHLLVQHLIPLSVSQNRNKFYVRSSLAVDYPFIKNKVPPPWI